MWSCCSCRHVHAEASAMDTTLIHPSILVGKMCYRSGLRHDQRAVATVDERVCVCVYVNKYAKIPAMTWPLFYGPAISQARIRKVCCIVNHCFSSMWPNVAKITKIMNSVATPLLRVSSSSLVVVTRRCSRVKFPWRDFRHFESSSVSGVSLGWHGPGESFQVSRTDRNNIS